MSEITEERVDGAVRRITNGHAPMRIPAHPEDADVMIAEMWVELQRLRTLLDARPGDQSYCELDIRWQEMVRESDRMRWELQRLRRVLEAAKVRVSAGGCHDDLCAELSGKACDCGHTELEAAIEAAEVNNEG